MGGRSAPRWCAVRVVLMTTCFMPCVLGHLINMFRGRKKLEYRALAQADVHHTQGKPWAMGTHPSPLSESGASLYVSFFLRLAGR